MSRHRSVGGGLSLNFPLFMAKHRLGVEPPVFGTTVFVVQNGGLGVCRAFVQGKRGSVMFVIVFITTLYRTLQPVLFVLM
jgi:hypothetical protein